MNIEMIPVRRGYDGEQCLVQARCCFAPDIAIATAQYLDVNGSDLFSGIYTSKSTDGGKTWSEFAQDEGLGAIMRGENTVVGCDATPMYHKKTGKILLLGHTATYPPGAMGPEDHERYTFYSVYDEKKGCFSKIELVEMDEYINCGNGCGQSVELENGDILIPIYYTFDLDVPFYRQYYCTVMKCSFDGEKLTVLETGNSLSLPVVRGLYEPSLVYHEGTYYMTMRNDECGAVAKSSDGLEFSDMHFWCWDDGSLLQNQNTQQHWMKLNGELYLVYTRRDKTNNHVFRHRAPLFAAKVEDMCLVHDSEFIVIPERGARLGNFGVTETLDGKAAVMAAEWMQPKGCEKYGSDNSIFLSFITK